MLIRKEGDYLIDRLNLLKVYHVWLDSPKHREFLNEISVLAESIGALTEKQKRKIQIGDIYKDKRGRYIIITDLRVDHLEAPVRGQPFGYSMEDVDHRYDFFYDNEGVMKSFYILPPKQDLILDKRYKMVEAEDE
jgi:hypothetical protein